MGWATVVCAGITACGARDQRVTAAQDRKEPAALEVAATVPAGRFLSEYALTPAVQAYHVVPLESFAQLGELPGALAMTGTISGSGDDIVRVKGVLNDIDGSPGFSVRFMTVRLELSSPAAGRAAGEVIDIVVPVWNGATAYVDSHGAAQTESLKSLLPIGTEAVVVVRYRDDVEAYVPVSSTGGLHFRHESGWLSGSTALEAEAEGLSRVELVKRIGVVQGDPAAEVSSQLGPPATDPQVPPTTAAEFSGGP